LAAGPPFKGNLVFGQFSELLVKAHPYAGSAPAAQIARWVPKDWATIKFPFQRPKWHLSLA